MDKKKSFFEELKMLMKKHRVTIDTDTEYDGHDDCCGTTYHFVVDGRRDYCDDDAGSIMRDISS